MGLRRPERLPEGGGPLGCTQWRGLSPGQWESLGLGPWPAGFVWVLSYERARWVLAPWGISKNSNEDGCWTPPSPQSWCCSRPVLPSQTSLTSFSCLYCVG